MARVIEAICIIATLAYCVILIITQASANAEPAKTYAARAIEYTVTENIAPSAKNAVLSEENAEQEEPMDGDVIPLKYVGNFKITYYCCCEICCGEWAKYGGLTASGNYAKEGRTVGADINVLPMGTHIYIDGMGERVVEDTGSAVVGNILDVFVESHNKALAGGVDYKDVYIMED